MDKLEESIQDLTIHKTPEKSKDPERAINVLFFSAGMAGKSCIIRRYTRQEYREMYDPTVLDTHSVSKTMNGRLVLFRIIEVGGGNEMSDLVVKTMKGAHMAVLCYRPTANQTEHHIFAYINKFRKLLHNTTLVCVRTCVDDTDLANASSDYSMLSEAYKTFSVSAKNDTGLDELLTFIGQHARKRYLKSKWVMF